MRRFVLFFVVLLILGVACDKEARIKGQYKSVLKNMEGVLSDLKGAEGSLGEMMLGKTMFGAEGKSCADVAGLGALDKKLADARADLDRLKPADMPMITETEKAGIDPTTKQPTLETTTTVDWGKVTGSDQKIWANLQTLHTGLAASLQTAEVMCQCIESGDKESLPCSIISIQMPEGRVSLDLETIERAYLAPVKELITSK